MKMSQRDIVPHVSYTETQCLTDIELAMELPSRQRGAMIAAAKKRLKAEISIGWVINISQKYDLDMTPTLAARLIKGWLGRSVSRIELAKQFSIPGRSASHKSAVSAILDNLIEHYSSAVLDDITATLEYIKAKLLNKNK